MIGAALSIASGKVEPFVVAQTKAGNWLWIDENLGKYGVMTPKEFSEWETVDVLESSDVQVSISWLHKEIGEEKFNQIIETQ